MGFWTPHAVIPLTFPAAGADIFLAYSFFFYTETNGKFYNILPATQFSLAPTPEDKQAQLLFRRTIKKDDDVCVSTGQAVTDTAQW